MKCTIKKLYNKFAVKVIYCEDFESTFGPFDSRLKANMWLKKYKKEVGRFWK